MKGRAFLLKIDNDGSYQTVAGMREESCTIENGSLLTSAAGIFLGSASEALVRGRALDGSLHDYELSYDTGEKIRARLCVNYLAFIGDFNGERNYRLTLSGNADAPEPRRPSPQDTPNPTPEDTR